MFSVKSTITHRNDVYPFISPTRFPAALAGKVVFIIDADRGIDGAFVLAFAFAFAGASVVCVSRRQADIDSTMAEIQQRRSTRAIAIAADLAGLMIAK